MVILDEPSSALDPLAEYNMYRNMMQASEGKGVLFISHRLSSARMANKVYLMKQGEIIEQGTHTSLMEENGEYTRMFTMQAQNYQESFPEDMEEGVLANG
jgi:ATP-binding cassette subfamily B protein